MNIMTIVILAVIALFAFSGWRSGLVRKLHGVIALILSGLLVSALLPYVTLFVKTRTPVYSFVVEQCTQVMDHMIEKTASGNGASGGIDRETIRYWMQQYGMDTSALDQMQESELLNLARQYFPDLVDEQISGALNNLTRIQQTDLIRNLPVPSFVQNMMLNYNNKEGYKRLGAADFGDYLAKFFCNAVVNVVSFVATMILVSMIVWGILAALDLFSSFPVIGTVDHLGGLVFGIVQGVMIIWIVFLVIWLLSGTEPGMMLMEMIDRSAVLKPLYESNLFLRLIMNAIS